MNLLAGTFLEKNDKYPTNARVVVGGGIFPILGDPGAVSRVDKMFVVKVYCKIETSPGALTLTEPVPEAFELPASDWPENCPWVSEDAYFR